MVEGTQKEVIGKMWADYAPIREEVGDLLSGWQKSFVRGNPTEVREEVRSFSKRQDRVFQLLVLCFEDVDQFWADARATLDEDSVDILKQVNEKFRSQLGELFRTVFEEQAYGHKNTVTDTTVNIELTNSGTDPVIKLEALSGRVPVFELHQSPAHFLDFAETHVTAVNSALELVEQFEDNDIENAQRQLERLEKKTAEVAEKLNSIETEDSTGNESSSGGEEVTNEDPDLNKDSEGPHS